MKRSRNPWLATITLFLASMGIAWADDQLADDVELSGTAARCNDGEFAIVKVILADPPTNKWLVYLQGGGSCSREGTLADSGDAAPGSCAERWSDHPRSKDAIGSHANMVPDDEPKNLDGKGIMDFDGDDVPSGTGGTNPFEEAGFNRVFIPYCSSDHWSGRGHDTPVSAGNFPDVDGDALPSLDPGDPTGPRKLHFAGSRIVEVVIQRIMDGSLAPAGAAPSAPIRIPSARGGEIVLAGGSAGGAGVVANLDRVAEAVHHGSVIVGQGGTEFEVDNSHPDIKVYGFIDAAESVGIPDRLPPGLQLPSWVALLDTEGDIFYSGNRGQYIDVALDRSCMAALDYDRCRYNTLIYKQYLDTPFMVSINAFDHAVHGRWVNEVCKAKLKSLGQPPSACDSRGVDEVQEYKSELTNYVRQEITLGQAEIGALNPTLPMLPGIYIPNYGDGRHDALLSESGNFFGYEAGDDPHLETAVGASDANPGRTFAVAAKCFRAQVVGIALEPACRASDYRVYSHAYVPPGVQGHIPFPW